MSKTVQVPKGTLAPSRPGIVHVDRSPTIGADYAWRARCRSNAATMVSAAFTFGIRSRIGHVVR